MSVWSRLFFKIFFFYLPPGGANDLLTSTTLVFIIITSYILRQKWLALFFYQYFFLYCYPFILPPCWPQRLSKLLPNAVSNLPLNQLSPCCCCHWQKYLVVFTHWKIACTTPWRYYSRFLRVLCYQPLKSLAEPYSQAGWELTASHTVKAKDPPNACNPLLKGVSSQGIKSRRKGNESPVLLAPRGGKSIRDGWGFCPTACMFKPKYKFSLRENWHLNPTQT